MNGRAPAPAWLLGRVVGRSAREPRGSELALPSGRGQMRGALAIAAPAVLIAAAAGGLTALARPGGSIFLALAVFLVLPLGTLVLGRPARAAVLASTLAYSLALMWAYASHFSPIYAYEGLINAGPSTSTKLVVAAVAALPAAWLPLAARRPSTLVLWALYLLGYVPTIVVPVFINGRLGAPLPFDLALLGSMATLSLILRVRPPRVALPQLSIATLTWLLTGLALLSLFYIAASYGVHAPPSLASVYTTRASFDIATAGTIGGGYIVPWAGNVINPTLIALGIARRRAALVILAALGELLIYADTGYKNVLFAIALAPVVYFMIARARRWFGLVASLGSALILVLAAPAGSITGNWSIALANRVFAIPGQIGYYYYQYFSLHQKDHLAHSFLRWFTHSSYSQALPKVVGSAYFPRSNPDANAHFWADAFANFGFAGIAAFTLVLGLVLWLGDGLGRRRDARVAGPMLVIAGLTLGSSGLFTTILTQGLWLALLLMALMPSGLIPPRAVTENVRRARSPLSPARRAKWGMAEPVAVREISNEEGRKLLSIVRRGSGSAVGWRRAQIALWSAQHMDVPAIAKIAFTSEDRVREVIHNFNSDGFDSLSPTYSGGRMTKLADRVVRKGAVEDISHEGQWALLAEEDVSFRPLKTWKESNDPDFQAKKNRIFELYDLADGKARPTSSDPDVVVCYDEFGPLNLQPHPGHHRAERDGQGARRSGPRRRRRATYNHPENGVRHLLAAYDLSTNRLYGHIKVTRGRAEFLAILRYVRSLHPPEVRIAVVLDNFSPHLSTKSDARVGEWARANNVELAYTPHYASWLNRIEAQFAALRRFCFDGTGNESHGAQAFLIRRYIAWRNRHTEDRTLREVVKRANVA